MKQVFALKCILLICHWHILGTAHAHSVNPMPVTEIEALPEVVDMNRAGYGFLNTSSEAAAEGIMLQECPDDPKSQASACRTNALDLSRYTHLSNLANRPMFEQLLKEKLFEYLALQVAANGGDIPPIPACLTQSSKLSRSIAAINRMKNFDEPTLDLLLKSQTGTIKRLNSENKSSILLSEMRDIGLKFRSVRSSFEPKRMSEVFLLNRNLRYHEDQTCPGVSDDDKLECMSIQSNRERIRHAFPHIFYGGIVSEQLEERYQIKTTLESPDACGRRLNDRFEFAINTLIGFNGAPDPMPAPTQAIPAGCTTDPSIVAASERGSTELQAEIQGVFQDVVSTEDEDGDGSADGIFTAAYSVGRINESGILAPGDPDYDPRMSDALQALETTATDVNQRYIEHARVRMNHVCDTGGVDRLRMIGRMYPEVVRQTILDMNDEASRNTLYSILCSEGLAKQFHRNDQSYSCIGTSGDMDTPPGLHVERMMHGFPYASNTNYNITQDPDGTYQIKTKINYQFTYDPSIDPTSANYAGDAVITDPSQRKTQAQQQTDFDTNTTRWALDSTAFFNQNATRINTPKVRFTIERCDAACPANQEPVVSVSTCYRAGGEPSAFATDFPGEVWDAHSCKYVNQYGDWQDAGNLTTSTSNDTVMHETGHFLGLADEYRADYYPSHALGEYGEADGCNSTMGNNHVACHKLFPRHLQNIIRPASINCPNPASPPTP